MGVQTLEQGEYKRSCQTLNLVKTISKLETPALGASTLRAAKYLSIPHHVDPDTRG